MGSFLVVTIEMGLRHACFVVLSSFSFQYLRKTDANKGMFVMTNDCLRWAASRSTGHDTMYHFTLMYQNSQWWIVWTALMFCNCRKIWLSPCFRFWDVSCCLPAHIVEHQCSFCKIGHHCYLKRWFLVDYHDTNCQIQYESVGILQYQYFD